MKDLGRGVPAVKIKRADEALDHIADHIVGLGRAIFTGLAAEANLGGHAEFAPDVGARLARHQRVVAAAHLALGLFGKALIQPFGDHQPEHPIAKEFKPFVGGAAGAAVGQRLLIQRDIGLARGQAPWSGRISKVGHGW